MRRRKEGSGEGGARNEIGTSHKSDGKNNSCSNSVRSWPNGASRDSDNDTDSRISNDQGRGVDPMLSPWRICGLIIMLVLYWKAFILVSPFAKSDISSLSTFVRSGGKINPWRRASSSDAGRKSDTESKEEEESTYSAADISLHNGEQKGSWWVPLVGKPDIWLSIGGIVFDVSTANGRNFYDVGAPYHCFAGKVVSRALVKGSVEAEDIEAEDFIADFRESEVEELRERVRFYEEKYRRVGVLKNRDEFLALGIF